MNRRVWLSRIAQIGACFLPREIMSQIFPSQVSSPLSVQQAIAFGSGMAIPITLDFTANPSYSINLNNTGALATFGMVQGMWIDNSASAVATTVFFPVTGQNIVIPAASQAYLTVLCPNPTQIQLNGSGAIVFIQLLNYPVKSVLWSVA